jgi:hypothetical protein
MSSQLKEEPLYPENWDEMRALGHRIPSIEGVSIVFYPRLSCDKDIEIQLFHVTKNSPGQDFFP